MILFLIILNQFPLLVCQRKSRKLMQLFMMKALAKFSSSQAKSTTGVWKLAEVSKQEKKVDSYMQYLFWMIRSKTGNESNSSCVSLAMMSPQRLWTRDSPSGWIRPSLTSPARWLQLSSTEVRNKSWSDVLPLKREKVQTCTNTEPLFCRFCLHLQWTTDVRVQHGEQEVLPFVGKQLLLELH